LVKDLAEPGDGWNRSTAFSKVTTDEAGSQTAGYVASKYVRDVSITIDRRGEREKQVGKLSDGPIPSSGLALRKAIANLLLRNLDYISKADIDLEHGVADLRVVSRTTTPTPNKTRNMLGRRREHQYQTASLSKALLRQSQPLMLLQGAPGTGKSVAMRAFAREVLGRVQSCKQRTLAFYVSLREFQPARVTATALDQYIREQINPLSARELDDYLRSEFDRDLRQGNAILLLDAFDEIPAVLGSVSIDAVVDPYVRAIENFVGGGTGRCVVASRVYKGPQVPGWTLLELVCLSYEEQIAFLRRRRLTEPQLDELKPILIDPRLGLASDLRHPLTLALLSRFYTRLLRVPGRTTELYQQYVSDRIRSAQRPLDEGDQVNLSKVLGNFAFMLTSRQLAGLTANDGTFHEAVSSTLGESHSKLANLYLSVAIDCGLISELHSLRGERRISFGHRRIQEFYATQYVQDHMETVALRDLALNPRWRETAVALLQVGGPEHVAALLSEMEASLRAEVAALESRNEEFVWSSQAVHLLELLTSAYANGSRQISSEIESLVGVLTDIGWRDGTVADKKFAIDCLPIRPPQTQANAVDAAFSGTSSWLRSTALRECASIHPLPDRLDIAIRRLIITMLAEGRSKRDDRLLDADLERLHRGPDWRRLKKLVFQSPWIVFAACIGYLAAVIAAEQRMPTFGELRTYSILCVFIPLSYFLLFIGTRPLSYPVPLSRLRLFFDRISRRAMGWSIFGDTSAAMAGLLVLLIWLNGVFAVTVSVVLIQRNWIAAIAHTAGWLLSIYAWCWGPLFLNGVRARWIPVRVRLRHAVLVPWRARKLLLELFRNVGGWRIVKVLILAVIRFSIPVAIIWGILFLLRTYGGDVGRKSALAITIALGAIFPMFIATALIRDWLSQRRVRRQFSRPEQLTERSFLIGLLQLPDSAEASQYLYLVMTRRTQELRELDRAVVRQLATLLDEPPNSDETFLLAAESGHGEILRCVREGSLNRVTLQGWNDDVKDQLGKIDELLRVR
jgi:hypothetical protein